MNREINTCIFAKLMAVWEMGNMVKCDSEPPVEGLLESAQKLQADILQALADQTDEQTREEVKEDD